MRKGTNERIKNLRKKAREVDWEERERALEDEVLDLEEIWVKMLHWASIDQRSDEEVIKLVEYLYSFECFQELEGLFTYRYHPDNQKTWEETLHMVYVSWILGDPLAYDPFEECDLLMNLIYDDHE